MPLDLYIHNYLIRKNMHTTAEIFAREANFYPKAVAINPPEGFLSEWWSLFWSVYSAKFPKHTEAAEDSSSKFRVISNAGNVPQNVHPVIPSPDANYMLQNICPTIQRPGIPNLLQTISSTTMPRPDIGNLLESDLSTMMPSPELKLPISHFSMMQGQTIQNLIASGMHEQERLRLPVRDLNSDSQLLNVDQLARMLPSSSNSSHPQEKVYKNPQLSVTRDGKCGTSLWRSTAAEPTRHPPKAIELKIKPVDADSRRCEQERLRPPVRNLNANSQLIDVDRLACLLPTSSNCSHPQEKVHKKPLLLVTRDDKCGTSLRRSTAAEPTHHPPKAIQPKIESADTDARMREQEVFRIPVKNLNFNSQLLDVDRLAPLLPSPSNCSHPKKNKKRQLSVTGDDKCGTSLKRSTAAEPTHHAPKAIQPKTEPADTDAIIREQGHLRLPVTDLNSNSQLLDVDQLARLLSSSSNCSHPQKNVYKKGELSVTRDDRCGTSLRRSTAAEPTRQAPKAIQPKTKPADTGMELRNRIPLEGCPIGAGYIDTFRQQHFSASAACFHNGSLFDLAAQTSGKLILSAS
ncbi:hypothetical protein Pfo_023347 [Paulownia fortunei]|nr:hypothetical protein Pfo_023347 [Paulownia fortunei]